MAVKPLERPSRIVVVRSAECPASQRVGFVGRGLLHGAPPPRGSQASLTSRGEEQAKATAAWLRDHEPNFDAIFVSPWRRAEQTLDAILAVRSDAQRATLTSQTRVDERLRDRDLGIISAMDHWAIAAKYPDEITRMALDGAYYYRPLGGESWADVSQRSYSILNTMFRDRANQRILVVTHGIVVLALRKILERVSEDSIVRLAHESPPPPGSVCRYQPLPDLAEAGRMSLVDWAVVPYPPELASANEGVEQAEAVIETLDTN